MRAAKVTSRSVQNPQRHGIVRRRLAGILLKLDTTNYVVCLRQTQMQSAEAHGGHRSHMSVGSTRSAVRSPGHYARIPALLSPVRLFSALFKFAPPSPRGRSSCALGAQTRPCRPAGKFGEAPYFVRHPAPRPWVVASPIPRAVISWPVATSACARDTAVHGLSQLIYPECWGGLVPFNSTFLRDTPSPPSSLHPSTCQRLPLGQQQWSSTRSCA